MTLGSVARVAMEYRQHLQMLNNISKLTANLSTDAKSNKNSRNCESLPSMEKLNLDQIFSTSKYGSPTLSGQNIPGFPTGNTLFDIASLMLFGTHALPVRLKILLDRLLCTLEHEELVNLLHAFGWTYEDYSRGYMLQDSIGNILTKWIIVSKEEEIYIIQLFLKFPETKTIAQNFVLSETMFNQYSDTSAILASKFKDYELKKLVDCTNSSLSSKNSLLNLNSIKPPINELSTHNSKNQYEIHNKTNNSKSNHHTDKVKETDNKSSSKSSKSTCEESLVAKYTNNKHISKISPVNHIVASSPKNDKARDKNHINSLSQFGNLARSDNLAPSFEYRKKDIKSSTPDSSQFMSASVSAANTCPANNPMFSFSSPLANFNPLLNTALLADQGKYSNSVDICKIDLSNSTAAAAAAVALSKDFSSFNLVKPNQNNVNIQNNSSSNNNNNLSGSDAMNLSQSKSNNNHHHHHHHSNNNINKKASKHHRKSNTPTKHRWDPLILSSLSTNPSTGKKRVQCNVCLKTFCDKGALKIHFSAVHLREMHKCTVDGCNMMFSSRRSRNRHSANPNPKLHTPNFRRKINPHDGRTANPYPMLSPEAGSVFSMSGVNDAIMSNYDGGNSDSSPKDDYAIDFNSMSSHSSRATPNEEMLDETFSDDDDDEFDDNINKHNIVIDGNDDEDDDDEDDGDDDTDEICIDLSVKDDIQKNHRKRKNFNPIKFAPISANNNQNYQYVSTDDDNENYNDEVGENSAEHDDDSSRDDDYSTTNSLNKKMKTNDADNDLSTVNIIPNKMNEDNDADTDIDIDDSNGYKSNHIESKEDDVDLKLLNNDNYNDSNDEHEVTSRGSTS